MRGTAWVMSVAVGLAMAGGAAAEDRDQALLSVVSKAEHFESDRLNESQATLESAISIGPVISAAVPQTVRDKLETAFSIASARVAELASCNALFTDLETQGHQMLATTIYYPANPRDESATCRRGSAFTWVGAAPTRVCRRFATLSDHEAAMVVIHEALHHAGLDERPRDRNAMSSREINQMVRTACGL